MKRPRRGFDHWISRYELPTHLPEDRLVRWYKILRSGQSSVAFERARQMIIGSHLRLGMSMVAEMRENDTRTEELVSEMFLGLVAGVQNLSQGAIDHHEVPNVTGYLRRCVNGRLLRFIHKDGVFRVRQETHKRLVEKFGGIKRIALRDFEDRRGPSVDEIMEVANATIKTERERVVFELRIKDLTDEEIAKQFNPPVTTSRVQQIRTALFARIREKLNANH